MAAPSEVGRLLAGAMSKYGLTQKQVAGALGVSDRMVRQVLRGERPGKSYEAAARQLATEGRVSSRPARRTQRVRAPGGRTEPVGPPVEVSTTVASGGRSQTVVDFPPRGLGRVAAAQAVLDDLGAHKGRARRVTVKVDVRNGTTYTIGGRRGYVVKRMRQELEDDGDDLLDWLVDVIESMGQYEAAGPVKETDIERVTLTYYY